VHKRKLGGDGSGYLCRQLQATIVVSMVVAFVVMSKCGSVRVSGKEERSKFLARDRETAGDLSASKAGV